MMKELLSQRQYRKSPVTSGRACLPACLPACLSVCLSVSASCLSVCLCPWAASRPSHGMSVTCPQWLPLHLLLLLLLLSHHQESARSGNVDPATAAAIAAHLGGGSSAAIDALSSALSAGAAAAGAGGADGHISHDYEFSSLELVKPTRMNKVYLVFACSILEQDLMFIVYNISNCGHLQGSSRGPEACAETGHQLQ